eukprot:3000502-Prymnesium_polylepis.1
MVVYLAYAPYQQPPLERRRHAVAEKPTPSRQSTNPMSSCSSRSASSHSRGEAMLRPPNHRDDRLNWCSAL